LYGAAPCGVSDSAEIKEAAQERLLENVISSINKDTMVRCGCVLNHFGVSFLRWTCIDFFPGLFKGFAIESHSKPLLVDDDRGLY